LRLACEPGNGIPKRVETRGIQSRIDESKVVILRKERLLIGDSHFYILNPFCVREIRQRAGVRQRSVLRNALRLKRTKVRKRILTRVVIVAVMPHEAAEGEHQARVDEAGPGRRNIVSLDLGELICRPNRALSGLPVTPIFRLSYVRQKIAARAVPSLLLLLIAIGQMLRHSRLAEP
jgi:hypothetical protein